jgi:hypothetical protein
MKNKPIQGMAKKPDQRQGAALILVLSSLTLICVLILSFLNLTTTNLKSSKFNADEGGVRQLSETCVNLVIAQIKDATSGGVDTAWASQPGMIRTYGNNGSPVKAFKLFSSDNMRVEGVYNPSLDALPADWQAQTGLYTDLNAPMVVDGTNSYPIVDPSATNVSDSKAVAGFSISTDAPTGSGNTVPMPVKWLYLLQDGSMVAAQSGNTATAATVSGATPSNPIIGRIAFWADDETCKVNLNTASEGTYWDTPRVGGAAEKTLAKYQPVTGEYQRYPGHPSGVCLSTIFPALASASNYPEILYPMTPRYSSGGSMEATQISSTAVLSSTNRLYASVDDFVFNPDRTENSTSIDKTALQKAKFFATCCSRSPEVNLFNKPRIAMWPIHADLVTNANSPYTTVADRLIAFCSTIGGHPYYFQRRDPDSESNDISMTRNQQLYTYLQKLTTTPVPGFGGNGILSKYGTDADQVLTEIFDYIRTTNLQDSQLNASYRYAPQRSLPTTSGTDPNISSPLYNAGAGLVVPTYHSATDTRGFGRFPTISEVGLWMVDVTGTAGLSNTKVEANLLLDFFTPSLGWSGMANGYSVRITGTNGTDLNLQWGPNNQTLTKIPFPNKATSFIAASPSGFMGGVDYGGRMGFGFAQYQNWPWIATGVNASGTVGLFPSANGTLYFAGGTVEISLLLNQQVVQTLDVALPSGTFPLPTNASGYTSTKARVASAYGAGPNQPFGPGMVVKMMQSSSGDVRMIAGRHSIGSNDGVFAKNPTWDNSNTFMSHNIYPCGRYYYYGAFQGKLAPDVTYVTFDTTATNQTSSPLPQVTSSNGVFTGGTGSVPGDWDNSVALAPDGPYINKPDEGNQYQLNGTGIPYYDMQNTVTNSVTYFMPNRQIPSPGMLGSLSTGVKRNLPWQTLLFRPSPTGHPGLGSSTGGSPPYAGSDLPDHLLLDLFDMPIVQPYAISEPFSSAGKINMNYQIVPFTYITRETAIRAALKAEKVMMIPTGDGQIYKAAGDGSNNYRYSINMDETLAGFRQRFDSNDIFRSPSEICTIHLVPNTGGITYAAMKASNFWDAYQLTGDNTRERPYTNIYQRLTTKSNTYTVHYRVQLLSKSKIRSTNAPTEFDESKGDTVTAEYRGSSVVERYVDPNDTKLSGTDFATNWDTDLDAYYRFRILSAKQFNP